jgi:hypothetical protein
MSLILLSMLQDIQARGVGCQILQIYSRTLISDIPNVPHVKPIRFTSFHTFIVPRDNRIVADNMHSHVPLILNLDGLK